MDSISGSTHETGSDPATYKAAFFDGCADNVPKQKDLSKEELEVLFAVHSHKQKEKGKGFSLTQYAPDATRGKDGVDAITGATIDIDGGTPWEAIREGLDARGLWYIAYSTYSHTPEVPYYRVLLLFSSPIKPEQWPDAFDKINHSLCGGKWDAGYRTDYSKMSLLPNCPKANKKDAFVITHAGGLLDPNTLPDAPKQTLPAASQPITNGTRETFGVGSGTLAAEVLSSAMARLATAPEFQRNNELFIAAADLGNNLERCGWGRGYIENELIEMGSRLGLERGETVATIRSGIEKGLSESKPLSLSNNNSVAAVTNQDAPESLQIYNKPPHSEIKKPPTHFAMKPYFPRGEVTLFSGHGGSGKSYLALAFAACIAAGEDWGTAETDQQKELKVLTASFEDTAEVTAWRMKNVCNAYSLDIDRVWRNWQVAHTPESFAPLVREIGSGNKGIEKTAAWRDLVKKVKGHDIVFIDNASDVFMANANDPALVREFIRELQVLARDNNSAFVLLGHIDKAGSRNGTQGDSYTGSAAWHNTVRSRIALVPIERTLQLVHEKANLSEEDKPVFIVKDSDHHGVPIMANAQEIADSREAAASIEVLVYAPELLKIIEKANERGEHITTNRSGGTNVFSQLKKQGLSNISQKIFDTTLNHLIDTGQIITATYKNAAKAERFEFRIAEKVAKPSKKEGEK